MDSVRDHKCSPARVIVVALSSASVHPCTICTHNTPTLFSFVESERKKLSKKKLTRLCIQISAKAIRFSMICTYLTFSIFESTQWLRRTLSHPKKNVSEGHPNAQYFLIVHVIMASSEIKINSFSMCHDFNWIYL